MTWRVIEGDCVEQMLTMEESSVDAIVTDPLPPYGLEFMGKEWDRLGRNSPPSFEHSMQNGFKGFRPLPRPGGLTIEGMHAAQAWHQAWAIEALRVLKPGGHLLAFGGTRTYHRLACAIEDAGFEIRDCIAWMYGSGFPKSLDVSKAIDKAAGAEREVGAERRGPDGRMASSRAHKRDGVGKDGVLSSRGPGLGGMSSVMDTAPSTPEAQRWNGWGTALKPAFEPIVVARKPLVGTVAANVLEYGTGALNIDGTRIDGEGYAYPNGPRGNTGSGAAFDGTGMGRREEPVESHPAGRWPANVILDEEAAAMLDEQSGERGASGKASGRTLSAIGDDAIYGTADGKRAEVPFYGDTGGASRFFYTAKSSREERNRGLEHHTTKRKPIHIQQSDGRQLAGENESLPTANHHPTVKPVELMRWLCRLVTPPGGTVLDPFTGSGSTGIAALREGFDFIGIEREPEYVAIARDRIIGDAPLFNTYSEVSV